MKYELHITDLCNQNCIFCSVRQKRKGTSMSLEDVRMALSYLPSNDITTVIVSGGEPLMHPHFRKILDMVLSASDTVIVETNGTLLSQPKIVELLEDGDSNKHKIIFKVSIHGFENAHNSITQGDNFKKVVKGLSILDGLGYRIWTNTVILRQSIDSRVGSSMS